MYISSILSVAALLTGGISAAPTTEEVGTTAMTERAAAPPTAYIQSRFFQSSSTIFNYVCSNRRRSRCLNYNTVTFTKDGSQFTNWAMHYGQFRDSYYGNKATVPDPIAGGTISWASCPGFPLTCFTRKSNRFICFNGNGEEFTWYENADGTVGLGTTVPTGATNFTAFFIGD